jgi:hypothetical protein
MKRVFDPTAPDDNDIFLGEGVFYRDHGEAGERILGATAGGSKFEIMKEVRAIPVDGAYGEVKGLRRYTRYVPSFTVNLLKIDYLTLTDGVNADYSDEGDYKEVTFRINLEDTDYLDNVTFVGNKLDGKACVIKIENVLNDGNIELEHKEKDELVSEMMYTGHYLRTALTTPPFEIHEYDI